MAIQGNPVVCACATLVVSQSQCWWPRAALCRSQSSPRLPTSWTLHQMLYLTLLMWSTWRKVQTFPSTWRKFGGTVCACSSTRSSDGGPRSWLIDATWHCHHRCQAPVTMKSCTALETQIPIKEIPGDNHSICPSDLSPNSLCGMSDLSHPLSVYYCVWWCQGQRSLIVSVPVEFVSYYCCKALFVLMPKFVFEEWRIEIADCDFRRLI